MGVTCVIIGSASLAAIVSAVYGCYLAGRAALRAFLQDEIDERTKTLTSSKQLVVRRCCFCRRHCFACRTALL